MFVRYITDMGINDIGSLTVGIILKIGVFYLILRIIDSIANFYMADTGHVMGAKSKLICAGTCLNTLRLFLIHIIPTQGWSDNVKNYKRFV